MWSDRYEELSTMEKGEFRRIGNYLLSHTYMVRYAYVPAQEMTLPNPDYQMVSRFYSILKDYFDITGWRLEKDDHYGILSFISDFDHNRLRIDRFTTLFLYTLRLIYEESREEASSFYVVKTDTQSVVEKMRILGLLDRGKTTQKERMEAQRTLSHYNVIQKMGAAAWSAEGNQLLILPSILMMVSNQGINTMMDQLEEMRVEGVIGVAKDEEVTP